MDRVQAEKVLTIGLTPELLELINRAISSHPDKKLRLEQISPEESDHKLIEAAQDTALVFTLWDGVSSPNFMALRRIRAQTTALKGRIHIIHGIPQQSEKTTPLQDTPSPPDVINSKQSHFMGIASWIKYPDHSPAIETVINEYAKPDHKGIIPNPQKINNSLGSPPITAKEQPQTSAPKNQANNPKTSPKSGQNHASKGADPTSTPSMLPPGIEIDARTMAEKIEQIMQTRIKAKQKLDQMMQNSDERPAFQRMVVFHPDSARASELAQIIKGAASYFVDPTSTIYDFFAAQQRDLQAAVVWFDGVLQEPAIVIRQIAENSSLRAIPTVLLIPDHEVIQRIKNQLKDTIFDSVLVYNRMNNALNNSLKSLANYHTQTDTARAVIDRLRRPFRTQTPDEYQDTVKLIDAENMAKTLVEKHGKEAWGALELIPYLIREGNITNALQKLQKVKETWPDSYIVAKNVYNISLALQQQTKLPAHEAQTSQALSKLKISDDYFNTILQRKDIFPHRLVELGLLAHKYDRPQDIKKILDLWQRRPQWQREADFFYLAGIYLSYINKNLEENNSQQNALPYFAKALMLDPERIDLMAAYGEALVESFDIRYGLQILRQIIKSPLCPWQSKINLVIALKKDRQFKEARALIEQFLQESPGSKALRELGKGTLLAS